MGWAQSSDAGGHFEVGTVAHATLAALDYWLEFLLTTGVDRIQAHRLPLLKRLQQELPRLGFEPMTPTETTSPIVAFAKKDTTDVARRLKSANVDIAVYPHRVRISPSVYNDMADVEKLLAAMN